MAGAAGLEPTFPVLETGVLTSVRSAHITEKPCLMARPVCFQLSTIIVYHGFPAFFVHKSYTNLHKTYMNLLFLYTILLKTATAP